jgi:translocation and assembly module TamB
MQASIASSWLALVAPTLQMTGTFDALATVRGTTAKPLINGQGGVRGARLLLLGFPHAFEALDATLLFYADAVVLDSFAARLGGGVLQASGRVELPAEDRALGYRFQTTARDVTLRYPEGWLVRGDGDLLLVSVAGGRQVTGTIELDRAYYLRDVKLGLAQLLRAALAQERVEVAETDELMVTTQLNVALVVPAGALRVSNNLADLRGRADLSMRGTLANPVVFGRVEMEPGGTVVYAENEYEVERAVLTFANPYRIEPFVDLVAKTKVSSYEVTLNLAGPLDRLNATFASDPPIADLEVLSLLATGEPDRLAGDLAARRESSVGAESFLAQQAASLVGQRVGTLFGLDRFRVAPITAGESGISSVRLTVAKRLSRDVLVTYSFDPSVTEDQFLTVEWQMSPTLALVLTQNGDGSYAVDARWEKAF